MFGLAMFFFGVAAGIFIGFIICHREQIKHRIKFKKVKVKCPTCNGEGGVPASDGALLRFMMAEGSDEALQHAPRFPCSECDGDKTVTYEFPRGERVEFDEEGRITSDHTQIPH